MRKLSLYALSAAAVAAMTAGVPTVSHAASAFPISGNRGGMMIVGGSASDLKNVLGQMNGQLPNQCGQEILDFLNNCAQNGQTVPGFDVILPGGNGNQQGGGNTGGQTPGGNTGGQTPDAGAQNEAVSEVVRLVNEERAKAGLSPLTYDAKAGTAAQTRAREIETMFSHTRPDGGSFSSALTQAGVRFTSAGENIAYGQQSPQAVMNGWMNSDGHRANILNPGFTSIGVGYYRNAAGVNYWTQMFFH